jgi:uncharacterized protein YjeT (DUF2065 family)
VEVWTLFFAGLGLAMFIEGMPYFVSPRSMRRFLALVQETSDPALRTAGFVMMVTGLVVVFLATR